MAPLHQSEAEGGKGNCHDRPRVLGIRVHRSMVFVGPRICPLTRSRRGLDPSSAFRAGVAFQCLALAPAIWNRAARVLTRTKRRAFIAGPPKLVILGRVTAPLGLFLRQILSLRFCPKRTVCPCLTPGSAYGERTTPVHSQIGPFHPLLGDHVPPYGGLPPETRMAK